MTADQPPDTEIFSQERISLEKSNEDWRTNREANRIIADKAKSFIVFPPPLTGVRHVRTKGPHVFPRLRCLAPAWIVAAKAEFEHMLQMDINFNLEALGLHSFT
nr:unnamed protein product [Spirometra erinaceieuropaei]